MKILNFDGLRGTSPRPEGCSTSTKPVGLLGHLPTAPSRRVAGHVGYAIDRITDLSP
jgi:hypothetical protein